MRLHSFHLARVDTATAARAFLKPPAALGLRQLEVMAGMRLGAPVVSPQRMQARHLAVFADWEDEAALERFLVEAPLGRALDPGWHVRLEFLRRWGQVTEFADLPERVGHWRLREPMVAVTLARTRLAELPRFISWGRPVERQVRDHPGVTLALAAMRPPRTVSTFSIWRTGREMTDMVVGRGSEDDVRRHAEAMRERQRRDFHREFTTLRFRPLSEHGTWQGRSDWVPFR